MLLAITGPSFSSTTRVGVLSALLLTSFQPLLAADSWVLSQLTHTTAGISYRSDINHDGTRVVFESTADITGENPGNNWNLFLWDESNGLFQITDGYSYPEWKISGNDRFVAFISSHDLTGENPDLGSELFLYEISSQSLTQITTSTGSYTWLTLGGINTTGSRMVFESENDYLGENSDGNAEIFLYDVRADDFLQITDTTGSEWALDSSISGDGTKVAWSCQYDLMGENVDGSSEIFLYDTLSDSLTQLTDDAIFNSLSPELSASGSQLVCYHRGVRLYDTLSGQFIQIATEGGTSVINGAGTRIAFRDDGNPLGENGEYNDEIFLSTASSIQPVAAFSFTPEEPEAGDQVFFTDLSTGSDLT